MSNVTINQLPIANTIDGSNDYLPIYTASSAATQGINRNTLLGLASAPVGLTDSQTLTNKILTNPTINGATLSGTLTGTYTIGGTPTFPSSVVTLTGSQTLTNKVLTSPTINTPTITNATISADTLSGFTVSNNGTVYGISVTGGTIGNAALAASSVNTTQIASGIQLPDKMKNPYKFSAYSNSAQSPPAGVWTLVNVDTKLFDTNTNFSTTTHLFTVPIAGFYQFNAGVGFNAAIDNQLLAVGLIKNTTSGTPNYQGPTFGNASASNNVASLDFSRILQLNTGDTIGLMAYSASGLGINGGNAPMYTFIEAFLVSAT